MKKTLAFLTILICLSVSTRAQTDTLPPYKKFPIFPPVKLMLADSSFFTKDMLPRKTPVLLIVFNPQCDHCQHETEEILKSIDRFKDIQIVMSTSAEFSQMKDFIEHYNLASQKNIVVGSDPGFFLNTFYRMHNMPFLAFYNKKKELISVFEGSMPINKVLEELEK